MLALQEVNLPDKGGSLSVRLTVDWFNDAILEKSAVVCRYDGKVVGYLMGTSLAANAHIPIIQAMLCAFPPPPDCYLYGPIGVAESERGKGLARALFASTPSRTPCHAFRARRQRGLAPSATENGDARPRHIH
ncbi:MAG: GNAT family N-acetyltransferase [Pseudolabrys sp.]